MYTEVLADRTAPDTPGPLHPADVMPAELQSREINDRATELVINSIASLPNVEASSVILADRVLGHFSPQASARSNIGIRELALMHPDPERTARSVNTLHERFGVPYRVPAEQAARLLIGKAAVALDRILSMTKQAADELNAPLPEELASRYSIIDEDMFGKSWSISAETAFALERFLGGTPNVRGVVIARIREAADELRKQQKARVVARIAADRAADNNSAGLLAGAAHT